MGPDDDDESTLDQDIAPPPRMPKPPTLPTPTGSRSHPAVTTRPIPRSQAPDFDDDGDFEGDDPPTTAEPVRDDHPQIAPRSPSIPTRPVPKFRSSVARGDFEDDDANPTMIDPHVPTGGSPRLSFDPHARIDDNRRTANLSGAAKRAMEPTADLGPAARRALADGPVPESRDVIPTAPIRKPIGPDPLTTAPMGSQAIAASSRGPRTPPGPTGPMLRPPPDAPPSLSNASGSQRAITPSGSTGATGSQRAMSPSRISGPQRALPPTPAPPFVQDRRAAMSGQPVELPRTIADPPFDGGPAPLRSFAPPPSQAAPTLLQRPAQQFDPHGRVDDSSRTNRWEGNPMPSGMPAPQPMPPPVMQPMQAISHKTADSGPRPVQQRPVHQVQMRPLSDLSKKTPAQGMGRLAPPLDPNRARTRKTQDVMIWGSVVVIIGSIVTLVIWLIAR